MRKSQSSWEVLKGLKIWTDLRYQTKKLNLIGQVFFPICFTKISNRKRARGVLGTKIFLLYTQGHPFRLMFKIRPSRYQKAWFKATTQLEIRDIDISKQNWELQLNNIMMMHMHSICKSLRKTEWLPFLAAKIWIMAIKVGSILDKICCKIIGPVLRGLIKLRNIP